MKYILVILFLVLLTIKACYHKVEVVKYKRIIYEHGIHDTINYKANINRDTILLIDTIKY